MTPILSVENTQGNDAAFAIHRKDRMIRLVITALLDTHS